MKGEIGSDLLICLAKSHFELLLEFSVFHLKLLDTTIFGKHHQVHARPASTAWIISGAP
jgi:hypothetical protein